MWRDIGAFLRGSGAAGFFAASRKVSPYAAITREEAVKNATVYSAVKLLTNTCKKVPITAPKNAAVDRRLRKPNTMQTRASFFGDLVADLLLEGGALVVPRRGPSGTVVAFYPRDIRKCDITSDGHDGVTYSFAETGETFINRPDEKATIIHVRDGMGSELVSPSRLNGASTSLRALIAADRLIRDVFDNGPAVSYFLSDKGGKTLGKEARDLLREEMGKFIAREATDEAGNTVRSRGGYAYVGNLQVDSSKGLTPADADLRSLRSDLKLEISACFGVPPFRSGGDANTKYSNASAANVALVRDEVISIVTNVVETFEHALMTPIVADTKTLFEGDLAEQLKAAVIARGGPVATLNEGRRIASMEAASDLQRAEIMKMGKGVTPEPSRRGEREGLEEDEQ